MLIVLIFGHEGVELGARRVPGHCEEGLDCVRRDVESGFLDGFEGTEF